MNEAILIKHSVFIRIIFRPCTDKLCNQCSFSEKTVARYNNGLSAPADDSGMNNYHFLCKFGNEDAYEAIEILPEFMAQCVSRHFHAVLQNSANAFRIGDDVKALSYVLTSDFRNAPQEGSTSGLDCFI